MAISSRNIFDYDSTLSKKKQLDSREFRIRMKERDLISEALMRRNSSSNEQQAALIRSQRFFELGFEEGFKRAQSGETEVPDLGGLFSLFAGALFRGNMRAEGGPVKKGEPYVVGEKGPELIVPSESGNVIPNDKVSPYFEASIGREDARNLKSNIVTESFFDTGKGIKIKEYEEKTSDDTILFKDKEKMIGSSLFESTYRHTPTITETDEDGGVDTFTSTDKLVSKTSSIAIPDLIEHQDQLLSEIHKIKGFENVTIEDVIQGRTGLDRNTMHNILANSDASFATAEKSAGRRNIPTDYHVMSTDVFEDKAKKTYNSEGIQPSKEESNQFTSLASDINQSVSGVKVKTMIQPVVQTIAQPVPSPFPVSIGVPVVKKMPASKLPNNIAKLIK